VRPLRACDAVVRAVGALVPGDRRPDWLREWRAELWHEAERLHKAGVPLGAAALRLLRHSLGALPDAMAMRRFHPAPLQEDLGSALKVVLLSPGSAGLSICFIFVAAYLDSGVITLSRFIAWMPAGFQPILLGLTTILVVLLPVTACIAAAAPVAWSEAGRREEAIGRAIGSPEARVRRQRALQGVIIALVGSSLGVWASGGMVAHMREVLADEGHTAAAAMLGPERDAAFLALAMSMAMAGLLGLAASWKRRQMVEERRPA
jgi:hypothetical protein